MHIRLVTAKYEHLGKHERDEGSSSVGWVYALDQLKKKKCNMQSTPVVELFGVGVFRRKLDLRKREKLCHRWFFWPFNRPASFYPQPVNHFVQVWKDRVTDISVCENHRLLRVVRNHFGLKQESLSAEILMISQLELHKCHYYHIKFHPLPENVHLP